MVSDCIKCVFQPDGPGKGPVSVQIDFQYIKTRLQGQRVLHKISFCRIGQLFPLGQSHRFGRRRDHPGAAGLDLDKEERLPFPGDQIDLSVLGMPVAGKDFTALPRQIFSRQLFPREPVEVSRCL